MPTPTTLKPWRLGDGTKKGVKEDAFVFFTWRYGLGYTHCKK